MKKSKIAIIGLACISTALVVGAVSMSSSKNILSRVAKNVTYDMVLNGDNGAAALATLKTKTVTAKTNLDNDIDIDYKNMEVVSGKIGKIKAKGFYGNRTPICGLSKIKVTSDAEEGDAIVKWGYTSACLDGECDLTLADGSINGNFFKIVAKNEVTVESVEITLTCDDSNNGFVASYGTSDNRNAWEFIHNSDADGKGYTVRLKSASSSHYEDKIVFPDFYGSGDDFGPVTKVMHTGSYGAFESLYNGKEIYYPETINEFGNYHYNRTNDGIVNLTYPRDLTKIGSGAVPTSKGLTNIYYNCVNLASSSGSISKTNHPNLKNIYVSYDVEYLNNSFISSLPNDVIIHYEGTEEEWASLVSGKSNWNISNVICSDTTVNTVKFVFADGKLGDNIGSVDVTCIAGKSITNPGKPTWEGEGVKVFDGWYTDAEGGTKVAFPYTPSGDETLYAHFIDMPDGYEPTGPVAISLGDNNTLTSQDLGVAYYVSYTATKDETILFTAAESDITLDADSGSSKNVELRVFNADGTRASEDSASNSPEMSAKKVAILSKGGTAAVKVRFSAGETYVIGWSAYSFSTGYWGTGKITATEVDSTFGDYTSAKVIDINDKVTLENIPTLGHVWTKFVAPSTGTFTFDGNNSESSSSIKPAVLTLCTIKDGVFTEIAKTNYSHQVSFVSLVEGETYYVSATGNYAGTGTTFDIFPGVPDGQNVEQPITMPVDGSQCKNEYKGFAPAYYKFVVTESGTYRFCSDKDINVSTSVSNWNSSSAYVQISKTKDFASGDLINEFYYIGKGSSKKELVVNLEAGTYYMKSSTYSSSSWYYSLAKINDSDLAGLTVNNAIDVTINDAEGQNLALTDSTGVGTLYKFVAPATKFYSFSCESAFDNIEIGTLYGGSSTYRGFSNSFSVSSSTKEGHKKLTAGETYYIFVKGTAITSVKCDVLATIKDGASKDTAYDAEIGTEYTANSSTTYYNIVALTESGNYMITNTGSWASNFKLYCGDSTVNKTSGTDQSRIYVLDATKSYRIEAYSCKFKITKVEQGLLVSDPLSAAITSTTTQISLENTIGSEGTYYAFTTDFAGWYKFSLSEASASVEVLVGEKSEGTVSSGTDIAIKPGVGKVVYLHVTGVEKNASVSLAISHPDKWEDGKSIESAWTFTPDAGYAYRMDYTYTGESRAISYFKVNLVAGVEYCFTIASLCGSSDCTDYGNYGKCVTDAAGNSVSASGGVFENQKPQPGGTTNEVGYKFTSTITGEAYINFKHYLGGPLSLRAYFYPSSDSANYDKTVEVSFGLADFEGTYAIAGNSFTLQAGTLEAAFEGDTVGSGEGPEAFEIQFVSYEDDVLTLTFTDGENSTTVEISVVNGSIDSIKFSPVEGSIFGYTEETTVANGDISFTPAN